MAEGCGLFKCVDIIGGEGSLDGEEVIGDVFSGGKEFNCDDGS